MKKKTSALWFGFLEAGKNSSPVARDSSLDTGNPGTIYLFNLVRGRILEYRKDIVELKLRDLTVDEESLTGELKQGFQDALAGFKPRGSQRTMVAVRSRKRRHDPDDDEFDGDASWPLPDDDWSVAAQSAEMAD